MKSLLIALMLSVTSFAMVPGGDHVGSGGGMAEKNVVFAYTNLEKYLPLCLGSSACRLRPDEKVLLTKILQAHPQEGPADRQIIFASEKSKPGFFVIDGQVKIAKTGESVGSPIYVNVDLLYPSGPGKSVQPLSLGSAAAMLVHELGHHHAEKDHVKLDLLGSKVETMLLAHSQRIELAPYLRQVFVLAIAFDAEPAFGQVLMGDGKQLFDLSVRLAQRLSCRQVHPDAKLVAFALHNLHWSRQLALVPGTKLWKQPVFGDVTFDCRHPSTGEYYRTTSWRTKLSVLFDFSQHPAILLPDPEIEMLDCTIPGMCH